VHVVGTLITNAKELCPNRQLTAAGSSGQAIVRRHVSLAAGPFAVWTAPPYMILVYCGEELIHIFMSVTALTNTEEAEVDLLKDIKSCEQTHLTLFLTQSTGHHNNAEGKLDTPFHCQGEWSAPYQLLSSLPTCPLHLSYQHLLHLTTPQLPCPGLGPS
jgi:hypothetical protein